MRCRLFFTLLLSTSTLFSHPHVFIDTFVSITSDKIAISWVFDEMSSGIIMMDYDTNKDEKLDEKEIAIMEKEHFKTLESYSYFTHLFDGKDEYDLKITNNFHASFENHKLTYFFTIPKPKAKKYELRFYDPEMFVALFVKDSFVTCQAPIKCKANGYDADFYYAYRVVVRE